MFLFVLLKLDGDKSLYALHRLLLFVCDTPLPSDCFLFISTWFTIDFIVTNFQAHKTPKSSIAIVALEKT